MRALRRLMSRWRWCSMSSWCISVRSGSVCGSSFGSCFGSSFGSCFGFESSSSILSASDIRLSSSTCGCLRLRFPILYAHIYHFFLVRERRRFSIALKVFLSVLTAGLFWSRDRNRAKGFGLLVVMISLVVFLVLVFLVFLDLVFLDLVFLDLVFLVFLDLVFLVFLVEGRLRAARRARTAAFWVAGMASTRLMAVRYLTLPLRSSFSTGRIFFRVFLFKKMGRDLSMAYLLLVLRETTLRPTMGLGASPPIKVAAMLAILLWYVGIL